MNKKLVNAVVKQLGYTNQNDEELLSTLQDIANHGIDGGYGGFVYHSDTVKFFKANRKEIIELVQDYADDFGQDAMSVVAEFRCLNADNECKNEIRRAIYGQLKSDDVEVPNALAWFAAEEVAHLLTD